MNEERKLRRKIYHQLCEWKQENRSVLELKGARQTGKTFIVNEFGRNEFRQFYYINCLELSGERFLKSLKKANEWEPGMPQPEGEELHNAFTLYDAEFTDDEETLVVIDEIQERPEIYSLIRQFNRKFRARFIVTGSYLSVLLRKKPFFSAGDVEYMELATLDFEEFLMNVGDRDRYDRLDPYGGSPPKDYDYIRSLYDIYSRIGGYPAVVKEYLRSGSYTKCTAELEGIIETFINESLSQFDDIVDASVFRAALANIASLKFTEKTGSRDLIDDLDKLVDNPSSARFGKKIMNRVISWLYNCKIIGYASKCTNFDILQVRPMSRFFFRDMGLSYYYMNMTGQDEGAVNGLQAENFVYLSLRRRRDIAGDTPWFATYDKTNGELDFFAVGLKTHRKYGIEVKTGKNTARTANQALADKKIDICYILRADTIGGVKDNIYTMPIYLADRITFAD